MSINQRLRNLDYRLEKPISDSLPVNNMNNDDDFVDDDESDEHRRKGRKKKEKTLEQLAKLQRETDEVLDHVSSGVTDSVRDRVAYILSRHTDARNSDNELVWAFWRTFEADRFNGGAVTQEQMQVLTKERSLIRWRAKIQNEYRIFQADEVVQGYRGTLEEDARAEAIATKPSGITNTTVYIDETGKTQTYLCVGSLWIPDSGSNIVQIKINIDDWRKSNGIAYEFHFTEVTRGKLQAYKDFFTKFLSLNPTAGFKIIVLKKSGLSDLNQPIVDLTFHVLDRGVMHEHESGRARLPRLLQVWMDEDEAGRDQLKIANIKERINAQNVDGLILDDIYVVNSASNHYIQAVDLFTGAINRRLHRDNALNHKDELSDFILNLTGMNIDGIDLENTLADNAIVFNLTDFQL